MKKYSEMRKKIKATNNDTDAHRAAAEDARKQAASFQQMKAEALAKEDMAAYSDACQRVEFYEQRAALEESKARKESPVSVSKYVEAWEDYAEEYNKRFAKQWAAFCRIRKEMAAAWLEVLQIVAEGNAEYSRARDDLAGHRIGAMNMVETLTKLSRPETAKRIRGDEPAEIAITAAAFNLDGNRRENMRGILDGWNTDGDIYAETVGEYMASHRPEPRPIFGYPVFLPETDEEATMRKIKGKPQPVGYLMENGEFREDPDFYERQEQKRREMIAEEQARADRERANTIR